MKEEGEPTRRTEEGYLLEKTTKGRDNLPIPTENKTFIDQNPSMEGTRKIKGPTFGLKDLMAWSEQ